MSIVSFKLFVYFTFIMDLPIYVLPVISLLHFFQGTDLLSHLYLLMAAHLSTPHMVDTRVQAKQLKSQMEG